MVAELGVLVCALMMLPISYESIDVSGLLPGVRPSYDRIPTAVSFGLQAQGPQEQSHVLSDSGRSLLHVSSAQESLNF